MHLSLHDKIQNQTIRTMVDHNISQSSPSANQDTFLVTHDAFNADDIGDVIQLRQSKQKPSEQKKTITS